MSQGYPVKKEEDFEDDFDDAEDVEYDEGDDDDYGGKKRTQKRKKTTKATKKKETKKKAFDIRRFEEGEAEEDEELSEEDVGGLNAEAYRKQLELYSKPSRKSVPAFMQAENEEQVNAILERDRLAEDLSEEEVDHQKLLPTKDDPKLFKVRVREGFEREIALNLMNKFLVMKGQPDEILIYSAASLDRYKGFVFVEADNKSHVIHALKGFLNLNIDSITLIEIQEMPDIYKPDPTREVDIEEDQWVRIKSGPYEGDIGRVVTFNENKTRITVKLVPRLGTAEEEENEEEEAPKSKGDHLRRYHERRKRNIRPPQRLFDPKEYPDVTKIRDKPGNVYLVYKGQYFQGGFMLKTFSVKNIVAGDVTPNYEESHLFIQGEVKNIDGGAEEKSRVMEKALAHIQDLKAGINKFTRGDKVKVISGDLKNLIGTVTSSSENKVVIMPLDEDLKQEMTFYPNQLQKHFAHGDKVVVIMGKNVGKAGTVIKVEDNVATLIAEDTKTEFACLVNDLIYKDRSVIQNDFFKDLKKYDLIRIIDKETFGCIIAIENISVRVVDNDGNIRSFRNFEIEAKLETRRNVARNSHNQNISRECQVRVLEGQFKGKVGLVKHVFKDRAFLYNPEFTVTAGIFVEHINNCYLLNATATMNPGIQDRATQQLKESERRLLGKKCIITRGAFKGHQGVAVSVTDKAVRVELTSINKIVNVGAADVDLATNIENLKTRGIAEGKTPFAPRLATHTYMESPAFNTMASPGYNAAESPSYYNRLK